MQCSRTEFFTAADAWRGKTCAVHLHTQEINGAIVTVLQSVSPEGTLEFSCHPLLQELRIDLSNADEFEFGVPEREIDGLDSDLVKNVADEMLFARAPDRIVFSMTRLVDPLAGQLVLR
jgi:hypothetical protein